MRTLGCAHRDRPPHRTLPLFLVLASILWLAAVAADAQEPQNQQTAGAPESPSYRMDRLTVVSGGTLAASPNYTMRSVIGQISPDGAASACAAGTVSGFGFWSVLGPRPAPIVLTVASSDTDPQSVRLSWSGVEELFGVYRAGAPDDLVDPQNMHDETSACGIDIDETTSGDIVYYRVVAAQAPD